MTNGTEMASELERMGIAAFCTTVTPDDVLAARELFAEHPNIRVGAGLHPWWVSENVSRLPEVGGQPLYAHPTDHDSPNVRLPRQAEQAAALAADSDFVGEIGLDFSPAHAATRSTQIEVFESIIWACKANPRPRRILSIHAVRAASEALDILEANSMAGDAACIFHWFSGTSDDLARLRLLNCYISVNERMLATRRGREYARQMPVDRLLLETDAPSTLDTPGSARELEASLKHVLCELAAIRGANVQELAERIAQTSSVLLGL